MANNHLRYDESWYLPSAIKAELKEGDSKAVRAEYTKLRDIAQKRIKRMAASPLASRSQTYLKYRNKFKKLKDIQSDAELASRLSDLAHFIGMKTSTVSGQKKIMMKSLKTLHEHDYTFVNEENYIDFGRFMEEYRAQNLDMQYDSGDAADMYGVAVKHKIDPEKVKEDFEWWLENVEYAKSLRMTKQSAGDYDDMKARAAVKSGQYKSKKAAKNAIKKGKL